MTEDPRPATAPRPSLPLRPRPSEPTETGSPEDATKVEAEDSSLGRILVDGEGRTLYLFLADTGPESTCYEGCAPTWPAFTTNGSVEAGDGVTAELATSERTDGDVQVTAAGRPLYYFASDTAPGDTNGQGIGDVWYVVSPAGKAIKSS